MALHVDAGEETRVRGNHYCTRYDRACVARERTYVTQLLGSAMPRLGTLSKLRVFDPTGKTHWHTALCIATRSLERPILV